MKSLTKLMLLLAVFTVEPAYSQVDVSSATLKGVVLDPNLASVPDAVIRVTNLDRGITQVATTGPDGTYRIPLLQPGAYRVEVEAPGFEKALANHVELTVGQAAIYDVHLQIGSVKDVMEVTADVPLIEIEKTQQANTLGAIEIHNLPNLTRNFTDSIFTLPGVSSSDAPRVQQPGTAFPTSGFSIGGSNGRNNLVTIDGGENDYGDGALRTPNISVESVQEFQVNRNAFAAELGFTAGTAINVVTKAGSNEFHGNAYAYFRDQATEARNFFDTAAGKPFDQNFSPGATLAGPIKKNRLFFFSSYEYRGQGVARFRSYLNTPSAQGINGYPAQLAYVNQLANSGNPALVGLSAVFRQILAPTNFPNVVKLLTANEGVFTDVNRSHDWVTRADYQPRDNDTITTRFSMEHLYWTNLGANTITSASDNSKTTQVDYTLLATWNHVFSPLLVNQVRVQVVPSNTADQIEVFPGSTMLSIGSLGYFDRNLGNPYHARQKRFQFEDSVTWLKGSHTFKFGASYRPVSYIVEDDLWFGGEFDFYDGAIPLISLAPASAQGALVGFNLQNGYPATGPATTNLSALQSFALGLPVTYRQGFNNPHWSGWAQYLGVFLQDSWKVSPGFTLNYGVRLDYDAEASPVPHNIYFSPRLGFAWDPVGDHKTIVRAGSGIFVAPINFQIAYLASLLNDSGKYINQFATAITAPGVNSATVWGYGVQQGILPFGQLTAANLSALGINVGPGMPGRVIIDLTPDYKNNYSIEASLSIARELARSVSLEIGYQMYRGVHLPVDQEVNFRETGTWDPIYGPQYTAIDPTIAQKNQYSSIGNSTYHGLTASLVKRFSHNFQAEANYTFSKAIDDVTDFNSAFASFFPTRLNLERGISAFNIKHNFTANAVYSTPARSDGNVLSRGLSGITLAPIVRLRSGIPFTIRVPGASNGTLGHSLYARPWYVPRDSGIGPSYYSFDLRLTKVLFTKKESSFRSEAVVEGANLLNHTNFGSVNDVFSVGDPRLVTGPFNLQGDKNLPSTSPLGFTSALPARQFQFGLKFAW